MANAVNVKRVIGRAFRKLIDKDQNLWIEESFWTDASDVEFADGRTADQKVGGINGITSDVNRKDNDIASSILPVHNIKSNLDQGIINEHIQFVIDENGRLGWKKDGADTVIPFNNHDIYSVKNDRGYSAHTKSISWSNLPIQDLLLVGFGTQSIRNVDYYDESWLRSPNGVTCNGGTVRRLSDYAYIISITSKSNNLTCYWNGTGQEETQFVSNYCSILFS